MKAELTRLKNRREELTKELEMLSDREERLRAKTGVLERMLRARRSVREPKQFDRGQERLKASEGFAERRDQSEDFDWRTQLVEPSLRGGRQSPTGVAVTTRSGSKPRRVRLQQNAIFSWSYKKLP
jgi:predicted nuclease with TOPRIM domain